MKSYFCVIGIRISTRKSIFHLFLFYSWKTLTLVIVVIFSAHQNIDLWWQKFLKRIFFFFVICRNSNSSFLTHFYLFIEFGTWLKCIDVLLRLCVTHLREIYFNLFLFFSPPAVWCELYCQLSVLSSIEIFHFFRCMSNMSCSMETFGSGWSKMKKGKKMKIEHSHSTRSETLEVNVKISLQSTDYFIMQRDFPLKILRNRVCARLNDFWLRTSEMTWHIG